MAGRRKEERRSGRDARAGAREIFNEIDIIIFLSSRRLEMNRVVVARAGAACARPMKGGVWPSLTANASVQKGTCSTGASIDRAHHIALTSFLRKHVSVFHRKHISVFRKTFFCLPGKTFFCFLYSN